MGGTSVFSCVLVWSLIGLSCSWAMSSFDLASSVSFPLTYTDAESSLVRSVEADPADLPESMPMRRFVAAGRALRVRIEKQRSKPLIRGKLSYEGDLVGDFYLTVPVGTPPQDVIFLADTGSEFPWSQCSPCTLCSGTKAPLFAFNKSSSFLSVPCDSLLCRNSLGLTVATSCLNGTGPNCKFGVAYGDGSQDVGFVAVDSFSLGPHSSKRIIFGCATSVLDTVPTPSSGLIGLSAGPFSFPSQLFSGSPHIPKKFAHCLPDRFENLDTPGTIEFGNYELPASLRYTPFVPPYSPLGDVYYYVDLQGITVGGSWIKAAGMKAHKGGATGGTIFDSGTALSRLVKPLYDELVKEMKRQTSHLHPFASKSKGSDLCYKMPAEAKELPNVPMVILHFAGKVGLELGPGSLLYAADSDGKSMTLCLAIDSAASDADNLNVIGNYQQQNYWVEYNLQTSSLGLSKAQRCAK